MILQQSQEMKPEPLLIVRYANNKKRAETPTAIFGTPLSPQQLQALKMLRALPGGKQFINRGYAL
jgi:hypothetical protein